MHSTWIDFVYVFLLMCIFSFFYFFNVAKVQNALIEVFYEFGLYVFLFLRPATGWQM